MDEDTRDTIESLLSLQRAAERKARYLEQATDRLLDAHLLSERKVASLAIFVRQGAGSGPMRDVLDEQLAEISARHDATIQRVQEALEQARAGSAVHKVDHPR